MISLEESILQFWKDNAIFEERIKLNSTSSKHYTFMDGPITANNPMGLHHAWGRTLKDLMQRYWAMKGYEQRFQNGFDCQGLWIEVEVEKTLGLNSKKAIEEFGLEKFSCECKERLKKYSKLITQESLRLGQWMQWDNSYYTHTDHNISYIWYFLKICHEKSWLVKDSFPMPWCVRCGTSLSQHEQHDSYKELTHLSIYIKFPLINCTTTTKEYLLVWTTTPWTLTANVAIAIHPNGLYCKIKQNDSFYYIAKNRLDVLKGEYQIIEEFLGHALLDKTYHSPFSFLTAQKSTQHKVVAWNMVSDEEGTGFVHIAPGCGMEDFELSKIFKLDVLSPIDSNGVFTTDYDQFAGLYVSEASSAVIDFLKNNYLLYKSEEYTHRYPTCWRCHTELVFRLVEEWFIDVNEIRPLLKDAIKKVEWVPAFYEKRMLDWLNNMGNWCISRKRYWGLPLPFFECNACGTLTVVGSKQELQEKAITGFENLKELHRPWIDEIKIACPKCNKLVSKVTEVGDCWLDAGIVPFSTLDYKDDYEYWSKWFPIDTVCEMREQIRLWFYSLLFMSITLTGQPPYKKVIAHEKVHDKNGRSMHRSWGNAILFTDAVNKMGADVIRWTFVKQPLTQIMNFGYALEKEIKPFFLTLWNVYSFFSTLANIDNFHPNKNTLDPKMKRPLLDQWLLSMLNELVKSVTKYLDKAQFDKAAIELEKFVEQLSTWFIRRSRRRFWKSKQSFVKYSGYQALYETLLVLTKLLAPIIPFFSEKLYQNLTKNLNAGHLISVHLCDFPKIKRGRTKKQLNEKMDACLEIVKLGRTARNNSDIRLRQPIDELIIWCKNPLKVMMVKEFEDEIKEELNVKKLRFSTKPEKFLSLSVKPNYQNLGPKLKEKLHTLVEKLTMVQQLDILKAYENENQVMVVQLEPHKALHLKLNHDLILEAKAIGEYSIALGEQFSVALNTKLTDKLLLEGLARDFIRHVQDLRKQLKFKIEDRIIVYYQGSERLTQAIEKFCRYISSEILAEKLIKVITFDESEKHQINIQSETVVLVFSKSV